MRSRASWLWLAAVVVSVFAFGPPALAQTPTTITGTILSDLGLPLGQVEIAIPGMGLGGLSRDDGRYTIVVPAARVSGQLVTLVARRLGFKPLSVAVTLLPGGVTQDFTLASNPLELGEVVVTGAGTTSETEKLGNVRNSVRAADIEHADEPNLVEALAAKAPNVTVIGQSGDPGASSFINIRGISSLLGSGIGFSQGFGANQNQPLFVVDGVPIDNSAIPISLAQSGPVTTNRAADLNPNDIAAVEILKGPAAGAIYGARAAAGVVLITTKAGRAGPTRFTLRSSTSIDDINHTYPLQRSYGLGLFGVHADTGRGGDCDGPSPICTASWGPPIPGGAPVFDHAAEIYAMGHTLDNGVTVSGGSDRTTFYLSGDNTHQDGVIVGNNDYLTRTAVRAKGSHQLTGNLNVGADLAFADTRAHYIRRGNDITGVQIAALRTPPDFNNLPYLDPQYGQHRSYRFQHPDATTLYAPRLFDNPFWVIYEQQNTSSVGRVYGNVNAEYSPVAWLNVNYTLGEDYWTDERLMAGPISSAEGRGFVIEEKLVSYQIDHNLTATARYLISREFGGDVTVGQNLNARSLHDLFISGSALVAQRPFKVSNTTQPNPPFDPELLIHDASWFGQATFDMWNQLHLTGALRNDGSSTFGRESLRSWFPKGSAAWEFTKALGERSWLSYGKARVAYGEAGQEPFPYLTSQTQSNSLPSGGTTAYAGVGGLVSSNTKPAPVLKPERSKELEMGADLGFWNDRTDASITWYRKRSTDVILLEPVAPSTGYQNQAANAASIENRGWEVAVNVRPVQHAEYSWAIGIQWARNLGKVQSLGAEQFVSIGDFNQQVAMVGQPIGVYLGTGFLRCGISSDATVVVIDNSGGNGTLGSVCTGKPKGALYIGADGFPQIDPDPRIVQDPNYNWTASIRTNIAYGKIRISALLDIRHGGQIWNGTKGALWSYGTHLDTEPRADCVSFTNCTGNLRTFGQGGWYDGPVTGPGAGTAVPIGQNWFQFRAACPFTGIDEPCIEDAGFVKLREVSISYTMDAPWVQRHLGFGSIELRVAGRNLKTWTKYTGYDPETNLGGSSSSALGAGGVDYFNSPQTRSFVFSITFSR